MNLKRLKYFVAVAEELHFGRAAQRLHMAQPPLSQQIRSLEEELGATLFERSTRSVKLTRAGELLLPEARRLTADADALERLMAEHRSGVTGELRVGFVDSASYSVMPEFLRAYRERWPGIRFELHTMTSDTQQAALLAGDLDVGIARTRSSRKEIAHTVILEERLYVAVAASHPLGKRKTVRLTRLADEAFLGFNRSASPMLSAEVAALLAGAGIDYEPVIEAEEYTTIIGLVAAGEGIAIVPAGVRSFQPSGLNYVQISDREAVTQLMILSRADDQLQVVRQALTLAAELF